MSGLPIPKKAGQTAHHRFTETLVDCWHQTDVDKKAAARAYKQRPLRRGVFAIRCPAAGAAWVGSSSNLDAAESRLRFTLRQGRHPERSLQSAWTEHGEAEFEFEVLHVLDADANNLLVADLLKSATRECAARLGASALGPW